VKCALELPQERLELDPMIFLRASVTFFLNLPMVETRTTRTTNNFLGAGKLARKIFAPENLLD